MNWYKLKDNKCPRCHADFMKGLKTHTSMERIPVEGMLGTDWKNVEVKTLIHSCGFRISEQKYNDIVSGMVVRKFNEQSDEERTGEDREAEEHSSE